MQGQEFYRYHDAEGRIVIVDSLNDVPPSARDKTERISYSAAPRSAAAPGGTPAPSGAPSPGAELQGTAAPHSDRAPALPFALDWPSFGAGFGAALLVGLGLLVLRRFSSPLARFAVFAALAALFGGAYLGWLRRSTGQGDALLASPPAVIQDARRAVEQMKQRNQKQEEEIQKGMREAR